MNTNDLTTVMSQDLASIKQSITSLQSNLQSGVTYMTALITAAVTFVVGGGLGWWFGARGTSGVQTDINTVKADVESLKTKVGA